jgi:hypothetical protein
MITMLNPRTRSAARLRDELTASHTVLREEAATCLHAMTAVSDGRNTDVGRAVHRFRSFLGLVSGYCEARRTLLWPALAQLFPSGTGELVRLTRQSFALATDVSDVDGALEVLRAAAHFSHGDRIAVTGAALGTIRPAEVLRDSLSLHLGDEELVLRDLLGGLSLQQITWARRTLAL